MSDYICSKCGASGVKLWRQYNTFADCIKLLCAPCSLENQGKPGGIIDERGKYFEEGLGWCDSIGWLVPAVPADGETYWGYTSVPQDRVDWWRALPLSKESEVKS